MMEIPKEAIQLLASKYEPVSPEYCASCEGVEECEKVFKKSFGDFTTRLICSSFIESQKDGGMGKWLSKPVNPVMEIWKVQNRE